jgi:hypothetical protein
MSNPPIDVSHERKALNEGIERVFMDCAGYAGSIRTHYQTGSGTIRDLFELFYFKFAVLFDLTSDLSGMDADAEVIKSIESWFELPPVKKLGAEMEERCREGLHLFRKYKIALGKNGIITLPTG